MSIYPLPRHLTFNPYEHICGYEGLPFALFKCQQKTRQIGKVWDNYYCMYRILYEYIESDEEFASRYEKELDEFIKECKRKNQ